MNDDAVLNLSCALIGGGVGLLIGIALGYFSAVLPETDEITANDSDDLHA